MEMEVSGLTFTPTAFNSRSGELTVHADVWLNTTKFAQIPIFRLTCAIDPDDPTERGFGKVTMAEPWYNPLLKEVPVAFFRNLRESVTTGFIMVNPELMTTPVYEAARVWVKGKVPAASQRTLEPVG